MQHTTMCSKCSAVQCNAYHLNTIHTIQDASIPSTAPLDPTPTESGSTMQLRGKREGEEGRRERESGKGRNR
jgi:hypothetical protein